jgi:hypothetical protein
MSGYDDLNFDYEDSYGNFNYSVWTPGTVVTLTNVPWNNDYRDIVNFGNNTALDNFINNAVGSSLKVTDINYAKPNMPVRLEIPFNKAQQYNYLRATNPQSPVGDISKSYYYFVTDIQYVTPDVTQFNVQLDVWQTFGYQVTFGNCYIERGHIGIANENAFDNYGRDYLTVPEGLDQGGEYFTIYAHNETVISIAPANNTGGIGNILVVSSVILEGDTGDYTAPKLQSANGGNMQGLPSGASYYVFDAYNFAAFMSAYADKPWITQGIMSITMIPNPSRYNYGSGLGFQPVNLDLGILAYKAASTMQDHGRYTQTVLNWRDNNSATGIMAQFPERYRPLKKFMTYPYMIIELTTFGGPPTILKPESWRDPDAKVHEKAVLAPPNQKVVIYPNGYNAAGSYTTVHRQADDGSQQYYDDYGDYLDTATQIANFPTLTIVNNMAIGYLASNMNGLAQQRNQADWSQQKSLASNQTSYDQATSGISTNADNGVYQRNAAIQTTQQANRMQGYQAIQGGATSVARGLQSPTPTALVGSAIDIGNQAASYMLNTQNNNALLNINNSSAVGQMQNNVNNSSFVRDTNKDLADWSAKGDYSMAIGAINAKTQDAQLTQPSTSGQAGGEAFNIVNGGAMYSLRWKIPNSNSIRTIGEYWFRYGYAVQLFSRMPNSLMVMTNFTYWKLKETYILNAAIPETFKQAIRGIFEKGVTVWTDPNKIGVIDIADNDPLPGITLGAIYVPPTQPDPGDLDEDDNLYLVTNTITGDFFTIGAQYCRALISEGITTPSQVLGTPFQYNTQQMTQIFTNFNIPTRFITRAALVNEYPDGTWSKEIEIEAAIAAITPVPADGGDSN